MNLIYNILELSEITGIEWYSFSGVYIIINENNGKCYIGSSKRLGYRKQQHLTGLNKNKHENNHLQKAWNKHGKDKFKFYLLKFCKEEDLLDCEDYYIKIYRPEYNINDISPYKKDLKHTEEAKNKISESQFKPVCQFDLNGILIKKWGSIKEAGEFLKISRTSITACAKGKLRTCSGFVWSYLGMNPIIRAKKHRSARAVGCVHPDGKIEIFNSIKEAAHALNLTKNIVADNANKKRLKLKTKKGLIINFVKENVASDEYVYRIQKDAENLFDEPLNEEDEYE